MKRPIEWAARINRRWIVHHGLGHRADDWMTYLAKTEPKRLKRSCEIARAMIRRWDQMGDPKPWFYAGLFNIATVDETKYYLAGHRLTTATVPAMEEDPEVEAWVESLCAETRGLLQRLRGALLVARDPGRAARSKE